MTVDVAGIGGRILTLREQLGLTVQEVADRAGVHRVTLQRLERGEPEGVNLRSLSGIAAALDVPVGVLLGERPLPVHWFVDRVRWRQVRREVGEIQAQIREVA